MTGNKINKEEKQLELAKYRDLLLATLDYYLDNPKGGISCSNDSFDVNQTLVFQIEFCGKSSALLVAANR